MIFGEFATEDAQGVTLAHTLSLGGRSLKKGRLLSAADIDALLGAGILRVTGARFEDGDVPEDAAAGEVALLLGGEHTETRAPYTGRCNLHAGTRGVVIVDGARIDRLNRVDESITIGTLTPYAPVRRGQVIATVKIIPFATRRSLLDECRAVAAEGPLVRVAEFKPRRAALILTELPGMKENVFRATVTATRNRLEGLGSRLALALRGPHEQRELAALLRQALAAGCDLVLISGATVTKDRADVVPAAIVEAGGVVDHFGMPVEPGNMLLLAHVGEVPIVNLPGCARSRRMNGLDWVLHRLLADLPVGRDELMGMGVGGLIRSPLEPEDEAEDEEAPRTSAPASGPRVAALVLAAGRSSRMGGANKLLTAVDGVPMVQRAVNTALASRAHGVWVVTGHEAESVQALLRNRDVTLVHNEAYAQGLSTSLRRGIQSLPSEVDGVVILLADMPRVTAAHVDRLIEAFVSDGTRPIVVPVSQGRRGNPILWPRDLFEEMKAVSGDQGARNVLRAHPERLREVAIDDDGIFTDVDTPEALSALSAG